MNQYTVLLARPGSAIDNCDTFLCFVHSEDPGQAGQCAMVEAAATDGEVWQPSDYRVIATFEGFHPDVSA